VRQVVAIAPDTAAGVARFTRDSHYPFPLLADPEHTAFDAYDVMKQVGQPRPTPGGVRRRSDRRGAIRLDRHTAVADPFERQCVVGLVVALRDRLRKKADHEVHRRSQGLNSSQMPATSRGPGSQPACHREPLSPATLRADFPNAHPCPHLSGWSTAHLSTLRVTATWIGCRPAVVQPPLRQRASGCAHPMPVHTPWPFPRS
jgi:hypothetical protein